MIRSAIFFYAVLWAVAPLRAQTSLFGTSPTATPTPPSDAALSSPTQSGPPAPITTTTIHKRGLLGRMMHPFSSSEILPKYHDPKLRGLILSLQVAPQPVHLSEVRQIEVTITVANHGGHVITLDFPTDQRIEVQLLNSADVVLTKWSENHAIKEVPATVLINPDEHIEYKETIATRDLTPGKVFTAEVIFPKYPELRIRQKFMTER
jgi:hypothetical protein